jgi:hypothetical protein
LPENTRVVVVFGVDGNGLTDQLSIPINWSPNDIYDVFINLTNVECDTETYNIRVEVDNSTDPAPAIPV